MIRCRSSIDPARGGADGGEDRVAVRRHRRLRPLRADVREGLQDAAGLRAEALDPAALAPGVQVAGVVSFLAAVGEGQVISL